MKRHLLSIPIFLILFYGCKEEDYIKDATKVSDFHNYYNQVKCPQLGDSVYLYIDCSKCSIDAVNSSPFFKRLRSTISGLNPFLVEIRGEELKSISSNNPDTINWHLTNMQDVNYANLVAALDTIVHIPNQAILITDGELMTMVGGEREDYAYLLPDFKYWLSKGFEIYVYIEEYEEQCNKGRCPKKRFYFIFTDSKKDKNIFSWLDHVINFSEFPEIALRKFSSTDFKVETKYAGLKDPKTNAVLSLNRETYQKGERFEVQDYQIDWSDIVTYIQNTPDSITGKPIPGGDYLFRGIFINAKGLDYYTIENIDVKVYNVYDEFRGFEDSIMNNSKPASPGQFKELKEVFIVDTNLFQKTGEVGIKIHPNFDGSDLNKKGADPEKENLLRVDIILSGVKDNFNEKRDSFNCFKWKSMTKPGINISVYESIRRLIIEKDSYPDKLNNGIIYTVYVKTNSSDL